MCPFYFDPIDGQIHFKVSTGGGGGGPTTAILINYQDCQLTDASGNELYTEI